MKLVPILPIAYFGNIEYFWFFVKYKTVSISTKEVYAKQTFRNRTILLGANGPLNISIPVIRPKGKLTLTNEIEISLAENWKITHWKTLISCYNRTPYFEFYETELKQVFFKDYSKLVELNLALTYFLITKLGLDCKIKIDEIDEINKSLDIRKKIGPKINSTFNCYLYLQTFTEKYGFVNNLSILDLLFNEGPNAICILQESNYDE